MKLSVKRTTKETLEERNGMECSRGYYDPLPLGDRMMYSQNILTESVCSTVPTQDIRSLIYKKHASRETQIAKTVPPKETGI